MKNPLFSRYRQGENRVTASILAVFERVDGSILRDVLSRCFGDDLPLVAFINQIVGDASVPDASISANFNYLFEVKTERGSIRKDQLINHLKHLTGKMANERLFVITPDPDIPEVISALRRTEERLTWFNFITLDSAIESILTDPFITVPELQRYLLRELQALFDSEGLLIEADVVVLPASAGYPIYLRHAAYICQADRAFRKGLTRIAFYADGEIKPEVPLILHREIDLTLEEFHMQGLLNAIDHEPWTTNKMSITRAETLVDLLEQGVLQYGEPFQLFILSSASDERTITLAHAIRNNLTSEEGRPMAWARNQRYVTLRALQSGVGTTTELDLRIETERRRPRV